MTETLREKRMRRAGEAGSRMVKDREDLQTNVAAHIVSVAAQVDAARSQVAPEKEIAE